MEVWAFGTSPHGLGLTAESLWALTPREHQALRKVANERSFSQEMFFQLRADLHNAWMQRSDGSPWESEDFGGKPAKPWNPKCTMTPEQIKQRAMRIYGPNGKGKKGALLEMPAVAALKGKGQPIPTKVG